MIKTHCTTSLLTVPFKKTLAVRFMLTRAWRYYTYMQPKQFQMKHVFLSNKKQTILGTYSTRIDDQDYYVADTKIDPSFIPQTQNDKALAEIIAMSGQCGVPHKMVLSHDPKTNDQILHGVVTKAESVVHLDDETNKSKETPTIKIADKTLDGQNKPQRFAAIYEVRISSKHVATGVATVVRDQAQTVEVNKADIKQNIDDAVHLKSFIELF